MKTSQERQKEFESDLKELLKKYDAEIELQEVNSHNYMRGEDRMIAYLKSKYDNEGNCIEEWTEINLGRCLFV
jgi:hypothetical protein